MEPLETCATAAMSGAVRLTFFFDHHPRDNLMDDLNRDGKIDYRDAAVVYDIIDDLYGRPFYARFLAGLARRSPTVLSCTWT